jgi:hypothetical protein
VVCGEHCGGGEYSGESDAQLGRINVFFSPRHKHTEGRAPVWGSEFIQKPPPMEDSTEIAPTLVVKLLVLTTRLTDCQPPVWNS